MLVLINLPGALRTNHAFVLGSEETSASKGNGYNDFEAMSFENLASKEDHSPAPSITPSIIRYLDSTELEADRDAIQGAVQRASPEDLSSRWRTSDLLSQSLSNQYQWWNAMVKDMPKACARCEKENLEVSAHFCNPVDKQLRYIKVRWSIALSRMSGSQRSG